MENETINMKKFRQYAMADQIHEVYKNVESVIVYQNNINTDKPKMALAFLRQHINDNEFDLMYATSAIMLAISTLDDFIEAIKVEIQKIQDERKREAKIIRDAHEEAQKIFQEEISPAMENAIRTFKSLESVQGYSYIMIKNELLDVLYRLQKATNVPCGAV